jgi:glutaminase
MIRERALKIVLVVVGLLFVATAYPMVVLRQDEALQMMLSVYVTLGIFLLLAARNPAAYRSVIAFAAWSSFAHAAVMSMQGVYDAAERVHFLAGSAMFVLIGAALLALSPAKFKLAEA